MDIFVLILAVLGYLIDKADNFLRGVPSWVYVIFYLTYGLWILQKHIDDRLDRIERRLDALQHPDYE